MDKSDQKVAEKIRDCAFAKFKSPWTDRKKEVREAIQLQMPGHYKGYLPAPFNFIISALNYLRACCVLKYPKPTARVSQAQKRASPLKCS